MATVESNGSIAIMKYNNFIDSIISISIRDQSNDDEVQLGNDDVLFLHKILSKWIDEANEEFEEDDWEDE